MLFRTASVLSALVLLSACGGRSTSDAGTGGSGGTGVGGSGGSGVGGSGVGGSGGTSVGGAGGSGAECSEDLKSKITLGGPNVGFEALPGTPGLMLVAFVSADELKLNPGPDGGTFSFRWVGPDLTKKFKQGDMVSVGNQEGWDYVSGDAWIAVARHDFGFVAPSQLPDVPFYGPHLDYAPQCSFLEGGSACGQPGKAVTIMALETTSGAGVVTIPFGVTETFLGWEITNVNNVQYPGYGSNECVVEAAFSGVITAVGPSLDMAE